jgi:hypothetical protein
VKKRKRVEPIPRNAFPHVVEKVYLYFGPNGLWLMSSLNQGMVSDIEAKELYHM